MRRNTLIVALSFVLLPVVAWGQQQNAPLPMTTQQDVYCSGMVTTNPVSRSTEILSGEQALYKITFAEGDYVYINRGADKGVKAGDMFSVMRPVYNDTGLWWFGAQARLLKGMGQMWEDEGRLKIVVAQQNVSIAQVMSSCSFMQRGDVVEPFAERPVPQLKPEANFDRFAPPSGKKKAMIVAGKSLQIESGTNDVVYVNLGNNQGVKVGDYFRVYRYQSNADNSVFQTPKMGMAVYGFGAAPDRYSAKDLPREIVGEGIVLRTTQNASTVLITYSLREIYEGDYCELE